MYAIIATGGKQYRVCEGDKVRVEKLDVEVGSQIEFDQVLMIGGDAAKIGNPTVAGAKVVGEVTAQDKAKKVVVYKYKPKKTFHKKNGHRQCYTEVEIKSIVG